MSGAIDERDIENLKGMMPDYLAMRFGITDLRRSFRCVFPGHDDRNPSAHYYPDTNAVYCHGCRRGGDVFAVKGIVDGVDGFPEQVRGVAEELGYPLPDADAPRAPGPRPRRKPAPPFGRPRDAGGEDCSEACARAFADLYAPGNEVGRRYLRWRGFDDRDIGRWGLGFVRDPRAIYPSFRVAEREALGFITIPFWDAGFTEARYCMVRTISRGEVRNKEWRPGGIASPLWNEWMLTASLDVVMVAEGLVDAMALHKLTQREDRASHGKHCMALGGIAGAKRLSQVLYHADPATRPELIVVCMDNDEAGRRARDAISADLCKIRQPHICMPAYPGGAKDADEWLMAGKGAEWDFLEIAPALPGGPPTFETRWRDG